MSVRNDIDKIVNALKENPDAAIGILEYESSRGSVRNYALRPLGPGGYLELVKESLANLEEEELPELPDTPPGEVQQAAEELKESFRKSLDPDKEARAYTPSWSSVDGYPDWIGQSKKEDDVYYLIGMQNVGMVETESEKIKSLLKALLPIGKYVPMLKLAKGKYTELAWGE